MQPAAGRLVTFTSGAENLHRVCAAAVPPPLCPAISCDCACAARRYRACGMMPKAIRETRFAGRWTLIAATGMRCVLAIELCLEVSIVSSSSLSCQHNDDTR